MALSTPYGDPPPDYWAVPLRPEYKKLQKFQDHQPPYSHVANELNRQQQRINALETQLAMLHVQIAQLTEQIGIIERLETQISILANAIMED